MDKWVSILLGGIGWLFTNILTYKLGKRSKIDDIHIQKVYEYAKALSIVLQEDYRDREYLVEWYNNNFKNLSSVHEAAEAIETYPLLYQTAHDIMLRLPQRRNNIDEIRKKSAIHLHHRLLELINIYIETTNFTYASDGAGGILINTYNTSSFSNLIDNNKLHERRVVYGKIMKRLRKIKP